jgi:DNA helicase IV
MIPDNNVMVMNNTITVNSIDSIKGKEGENCLFILTTDLASYMFGNKKDNTITKNRLYVALTRSLDKLTIFITEEVEKKYGKKEIIDFFNKIYILE